MKYAARIDDNHGEIREAARKLGAGWVDCYQLKNFCDGLLVYRGVTVAIEIKDGNKPPSSRKLTEGEEKFKGNWEAKGGKYAVIENTEQLTGLLNTIATYRSKTKEIEAWKNY